MTYKTQLAAKQKALLSAVLNHKKRRQIIAEINELTSNQLATEAHRNRARVAGGRFAHERSEL